MKDVFLTGNNIIIRTLKTNDFEELEKLASDEKIWQHYIMDYSKPGKLANALNEALIEFEADRQHPFVIIHKQTSKIIGSTRFLDIQHKHKKLEIGWTWLHSDFRNTGINTECKTLLLNYCFDILKLKSVQLKTDELNIRSRKAIEKTGAKFEGIIRNDMIRENGTSRNSASYSIIAKEWNKENFEYYNS
ncbi:MAG: GNAT family N-acetyltransferase [Bacteroidia bacterium]|nr:GNAT family N-acetyltransferase [Bacteroidia bacterium]